MIFELGILGQASESSAILIVNRGQQVHHVWGSGMEWRDMLAGTPPLAIIQMLWHIANEAGLDHPESLAKEARTVVAVSGLDGRFSARSFEDMMGGLGITWRSLEVSRLAQAAHVGAFLGGPGILLRCGHGTSVWVRRPDGEEAMLGGWGGIVGDHGSGPWLGRQALISAARTADGLADSMEEEFVSKLASAERVATAQQLLNLLAVQTRFGGLFQLRRFLYGIGEKTIQLAQNGDKFAAGMVEKSHRHLVDLTRAAVHRFSSVRERLPICIRGSLAERNPYFCELLIDRLTREVEDIVIPPDRSNGAYSPIVGVGLLAMELRTAPRIEQEGNMFLRGVDSNDWALPTLRTLAKNRSILKKSASSIQRWDLQNSDNRLGRGACGGKF